LTGKFDQKMSKCFLDIDIGDPAVYASELAEYERACKFLKANGRGYGLEGEKAAELNDAGKEMLLEVWFSFCFDQHAYFHQTVCQFSPSI
jgi:hypothetical protein